MEATLRYPVQRVSGIVASRLFLVLLAIVALGLVISLLVDPQSRTITVSSPTLAQVDSLSHYDMACPCSTPSTTVNDTFPVSFVVDPICHDNFTKAAKACSTNLFCTGDGMDKALNSIVSVCTVARNIHDMILQEVNTRRIVSPSLMSRESFAALAAAHARSARSQAVMLLNGPYSLLETVNLLERYVSLEAIAGSYPIETATVRSAGTARVDVRKGIKRRWLDFSGVPCLGGVESQEACERLPHCRWNASKPVQCDSNVCPSDTPKDACNASPTCLFYNLTEVFGVTVCSERPCSDRGPDCDVSTVGAGAGISPEGVERWCEVVEGPGHRVCQTRQLVCGSYTTEADCNGLAPALYCRWDRSRDKCGFIQDWTCPGGQPRSNCSVSDAASLLTNDAVPSYLLNGGGSAPSPGSADLQPDLLTLQRISDGSNPFLAPLWRVTRTANCSCFDDFTCTAPGQYTLASGEVFRWQWACTRAATLSSFSLNVYNAPFWTEGGDTGYSLPVRPLSTPSAFDTFADAFSASFMTGSVADADYERYFGVCNPRQCTYIDPSPPSLVSVLTSVLGVIGGLVVVLQSGTYYLTRYILTPLVIEPYVRARPHVFGECPPPIEVSELLAGAAVAEEERWVQEDDDNGDGDGSKAAKAGKEQVPGSIELATRSSLPPRQGTPSPSPTTSDSAPLIATSRTPPPPPPARATSTAAPAAPPLTQPRRVTNPLSVTQPSETRPNASRS